MLMGCGLISCALVGWRLFERIENKAKIRMLTLARSRVRSSRLCYAKAEWTGRAEVTFDDSGERIPERRRNIYRWRQGTGIGGYPRELDDQVGAAYHLRGEGARL